MCFICKLLGICFFWDESWCCGSIGGCFIIVDFVFVGDCIKVCIVFVDGYL